MVGCEFEDVRHGKRLRQLLEQLSHRVGATTPWACQDWANTKAAYRFFDNERISESNIFAGHFACTRERSSASRGFPLLVLHDTTEFSYRHEDTASIGILKKIPAGHKGRTGLYTSCGILMHSSLVATRDGLPLGLAAIKFWSRDKFHGANALKRRINPTRVPIEKKESIRWLENLRQSTELLADPGRCVHIGDRESDIYELYCLAQQQAPISWCAPASTGGPEMANIRFAMRLNRLQFGDYIVFRCGTSKGSFLLQFLKFAIDAWWFAHPSASRKSIRN